MEWRRPLLIPIIPDTPSEWELLPPPEGVFNVGIDGGYVRNWFDKKHKFEVIVGKSILSFEEDEDRTLSLKRAGRCRGDGRM